MNKLVYFCKVLEGHPEGGYGIPTTQITDNQELRIKSPSNKYLLTMKARKTVLCIMALATMFLLSCNKENNNNGGNDGNGGNGGNNDNVTSVVAGTTWELIILDDPDYHADVTHTLIFGQDEYLRYTREIDNEEEDYHYTSVMAGTYTFDDGSGVALMYLDDDPNHVEYRITFSVSGDELTWNFNLKHYVLYKI